MDYKENNLTQWPRRETTSFNYGIFKNLNNTYIKNTSVHKITLHHSCVNQDSQNIKFKEEIYSKNKDETKSLDDLGKQIKTFQKTTERNFKDIGNKQDEFHTEQMAEHQKTRDELLIDNGKLQEKVDTLQEKVETGWKEPKNWSIPFIISVIAGLVIWAVQSFS